MRGPCVMLVMVCAEKKGTITPGRGQEDPNSGNTGSFFKAGGAAQADMVSARKAMGSSM
jgi:hypothetical protein